MKRGAGQDPLIIYSPLSPLIFDSPLSPLMFHSPLPSLLLLTSGGAAERPGRFRRGDTQPAAQLGQQISQGGEVCGHQEVLLVGLRHNPPQLGLVGCPDT